MRESGILIKTKEMEKEFKYGQMVLSMRDIGKETRLMGEED